MLGRRIAAIGCAAGWVGMSAVWAESATQMAESDIPTVLFPATVSPKPPSPEPAPVGTPGRAKKDAGVTSLWGVQGTNNIVFLLGTIHALRAQDFPLPPLMEAAYEQSSQVVFEVNLTPEAMKQAILAHAETDRGYPAGENLRTYLPQATYYLLKNRIEAMGIPMQVVDRMTPATAAMLVGYGAMSRSHLRLGEGVDAHFMARARKDRKAVSGLETVDFQLGLIEKQPFEVQAKMLASQLAAYDAASFHFVALVEAWRRGDTDRIDRLMSSSTVKDPAVRRFLLEDRNRRWIPKIERHLGKKRDVMIAVGVGHMSGHDSVIEMLRARGHYVEQIQPHP